MFGNRKEEKKGEKYTSFPCLVCKSKKNDSSFFFFFFFICPHILIGLKVLGIILNFCKPKFFMNSLSITALPTMDILRTVWVRFASFSFPSHKPNRGNVF